MTCRVFVLLLLLAVPLPASADTAPAAYLRLKEAGTVSFRLGDFSAALSRYSEAYKLHQDPRMLYNIAQCHRHLGHTEKATFFYKQHLERWRRLNPGSESPVKAAVDKHLAALEAKLRQEAAARRQEAEAAPAQGEVPERVGLPEGQGRGRTFWAWTTLGVGLACAAGAGVLYGVGSTRVSSAYAGYSGLTAADAGATFDEKWAEVESAGDLYIGGHVLAGLAAAAVGVSIYLFATRPSAAERAAAAAERGLRLGLSADGQGAGLFVRGDF